MSSNALDKSVNRLLIGAPRRPVDTALMKKLSKMLGDLELVKEAHLPEVVELGVGKSAELTLLVVVVSDSAIIPVTGILEVRIEHGFPADQQIALRVVTEDFPLLAVARSVQCVVGWRD